MYMRPEVEKITESEIEFLSADIKEHTVTYEFIEDKKEGCINVQIKNQTRKYDPILFCEFLFLTYTRKANNAKFKNNKINLNEQARIYLECKSNITQVAERFKRK